MNTSSDRNLLFGVLAWQNGVISAPQLLDGMKLWTANKSKPLGEILVEQKILSAQQRIALDSMVEANLRLHVDDPAQTIQHLGMSAAVLRDLKRDIDDPDVQASLNYSTFFANTDENSADHATFPAVTSSSGERFRILRPHAKGGLGEVFVAHDNELNRDVALKEIRHRYSDQTESRERFLLEAEVTGRLEHPGIVPVYALGKYADGRPYYAMRFIRGESLQQALTQFHAARFDSLSDRQLELRKLLGRFVDVCQSISYAHSRGVLHRDLKPANIMLGGYGETLVVDWGLARIIGHDESSAELDEQTLRVTSASGVTPTLMGSAIGTPAYMPPEQATGQLDELSCASDVYSLGATLYHLVTGQPPFTGNDVAEVLERVKSGKFPSAKSVDHRVPRALDAICGKAMALKPQDRYQNPNALAEDLERFLADESVSAFAEPVIVRTRRWLRKHQTFAATSAASLLLTLVGLGAFSAVVSSKNSELSVLNATLDRNNLALDQTNVDLLAANAREQQARTAAEENATAAKKQSELALSTLTSVINDIQVGLSGLPGGGEVRRRLLETSMQKLEGVATQFVMQASVDYGTMQALIQMGDLVLMVGGEKETQTTPQSEATPQNESVLDVAASFYQRGFDIAGSLSQQYPDDPAVGMSLAEANKRMGDIQSAQGDIPSATASYKQALDIALKLTAAEPEDMHFQRQLAGFHNALGHALFGAGDLAGALTEYDKSLLVTQMLADAMEDSSAISLDLLRVYDNTASIYSRIGEMERARQRYQECVEIATQLVQDMPDEPQTTANLAYAHSNLGWVYYMSGDKAGCLEHYLASLTLSQQLAQADPEDRLYANWVASAHDRVGEVHFESGEMTNALPEYEASFNIYRDLYAADPTNVQGAMNVASAHMRLGDTLAEIDRLEEARTHFQSTLDLYLDLKENVKSNTNFERGLATAYERIGTVQMHDRQLEEAAETFGLMLDIKRSLAEASPRDTLAKQELSITYRHLGDVSRQAGRAAETLEQYQVSLRLAQEAVQIEPNSAILLHHLASCFSNVAEAHIMLADYASAEASYTGAIDVRREMIASGMVVEASQQQLDYLQDCVDSAQLAPQAMESWEALLALPEAEHEKLFTIRGIVLAQQRDLAGMVETAKRLSELNANKTENLYNAACLLSLAYDFSTPSVTPAVDTSEPAPSAERESWKARAIEHLRTAIQGGFRDKERLANDSDLWAIRHTPEFQELIGLVERVRSEE